MNGKYAIGRTVKVIEDKNRKELFTGEKETRSFPVSIFYPTVERTGEQERNLTSLFYPAIKKAVEFFGNAGISEEKLNEIKIPVKENAKPVQGSSFPIVLLSPGFGIDRDLYMETMTALVQKGIVVVTLSVPYDSLFTIYPDNKVIPQADRFPDDRIQVNTRVEDICLVLDYLEKWNQRGSFEGIFDLEKIGLIGHSLGGAAVFNVAAIDNRVKGAVLLDASMHLIGDVMPNVPILNLRQEAASYEEYLTVIGDDQEKARSYLMNQQRMYRMLQSGSLFMKVVGANHLTFSTLGTLIFGTNPVVSDAILEAVSTFFEGLFNSRIKLPGQRIKNKNLVEINGSGHPIHNHRD
ncbi:alpha/beta hydrolase family protein [Falsibacillus pallidus]|uniref:alpha/beta hydrolase family protein n=1 Tax=Falsibacillus pallidus TaxID=493781 RepID=UPI001314FEAA|nr:alpha/beta hydrolase family protein [Falsibacillus pallidus]